MLFYTARYVGDHFLFSSLSFFKWKMQQPLSREPDMELIAILFKKFTNDSVEITMEKESRKEL